MHRKRKIALTMAVVLVIAGVGVYGGNRILKIIHLNNRNRQIIQIKKTLLRQRRRIVIYCRQRERHREERTISYTI